VDPADASAEAIGSGSPHFSFRWVAGQAQHYMQTIVTTVGLMLGENEKNRMPCSNIRYDWRVCFLVSDVQRPADSGRL